jgi:hypothetical protein
VLHKIHLFSKVSPRAHHCLFFASYRGLYSWYDVDGPCDFQQTTLRALYLCGQSSAAPHTPPWLPPRQCQPTSHRLILTLILLADRRTPDRPLLLAGLRPHRLAGPCHQCSRHMLTNNNPSINLEARVPAISEWLWVEALIRQGRVQDNMLGRTGKTCLRRRKACRPRRGLRRLTPITNSRHFAGNRKQNDLISVTEVFRPLPDPLHPDNPATRILTHVFHHAHPIRRPNRPLPTTAGNHSNETAEQSLAMCPTLAFHDTTRQRRCRRLSLL